jgi:uncharacterized SAM-binding protein YcdF (DUF218 family)
VSRILNDAAHLLLVPPGLLILILAAGLLLSYWRVRAGRRVAWCGVGLLLALCLPVVDRALSRVAGGYAPFNGDPGSAQAIVVLAGEARRAPEFGAGYSVSDLTLERVRYGARLARQTGLPVLLSGGVVGTGAPALAQLMQAALHDDFGVDARWVEAHSGNTRENARESAAILHAADIHTVLLVTDDNHMRRAAKEFAAAGVKTVPAPVRIPAAPESWEWRNLRPSLAALRGSSLAIYELAGQAAQVVDPP